MVKQNLVSGKKKFTLVHGHQGNPTWLRPWSVVSCCAAASWRAEACGAMRAGFGSEGSVVVRDCERGEGEREREEVGAHFCELFPPFLLSCFSIGVGGVALLSVAAGSLAGSPIYRGERKRLASPGQECRGSAEASGRHGRCCGGWCLASWELVAMVLRHAS